MVGNHEKDCTCKMCKDSKLIRLEFQIADSKSKNEYYIGENERLEGELEKARGEVDRLNKQVKELKEKLEKINNLETYELEYTGGGYSDYRSMVGQDTPVKDEYLAGDYVETEALKAILNPPPKDSE